MDERKLLSILHKHPGLRYTRAGTWQAVLEKYPGLPPALLAFDEERESIEAAFGALAVSKNTGIPGEADACQTALAKAASSC
jgi:hypothetical protein